MRAVMTAAFLVLASGPALAQQAGAPQTGDTHRTVGSTAETIVKRPLQDLNIIKPKVPPLLESIMAKPYALDGMKRCPQFSAAISELTGVLGPDVDSAQAQAKGNGASEFALGAVSDVAGGLIPGGGVIRRISGADKVQRHATAAVYAGSVRRAFLKGTARARGCKV